MGVLLVASAIVLIGGQFAATKLFQKNVQSTLFSDIFFAFAVAVISIPVFLILSLAESHTVGFTWFTFLISFGVTACVRGYTLLGLKAVTIGKLSIFTMFVMLGGAVLPYFYGILFLEEKVSDFNIIGLIVLTASLFLPMWEKKTERSGKPVLFFALCILAFFLNGMTSILSKIHQISATNALTTFQFSFWQTLLGAVSLAIVLPFTLRKNESNVLTKKEIVGQCFSRKSVSIILLAMLAMNLGSVCNLYAAKFVPSTLLYPLITGGVILVTAIIGRLAFREKMTPVMVVSILLNIVAIILILI